MSDQKPNPALNGSSDPLRDFCQRLSRPLEQVSNLIYLASHKDVDREQSLVFLGMARTALDEICDAVGPDCRQSGE